jgi:ABC-type cobalamin transport system permease subunit
MPFAIRGLYQSFTVSLEKLQWGSETMMALFIVIVLSLLLPFQHSLKEKLEARASARAGKRLLRYSNMAVVCLMVIVSVLVGLGIAVSIVRLNLPHVIKL